MPEQPTASDLQNLQRARVRKTVGVMAVVAVGIYVAFILSGVLGR